MTEKHRHVNGIFIILLLVLFGSLYSLQILSTSAPDLFTFIPDLFSSSSSNKMTGFFALQINESEINKSMNYILLNNSSENQSHELLNFSKNEGNESSADNLNQSILLNNMSEDEDKLENNSYKYQDGNENKKDEIKNPNHSRAVGILKPQIGIIDIAAELRGFEPNLSNKNIDESNNFSELNHILNGTSADNQNIDVNEGIDDEENDLLNNNDYLDENENSTGNGMLDIPLDIPIEDNIEDNVIEHDNLTENDDLNEDYTKNNTENNTNYSDDVVFIGNNSEYDSEQNQNELTEIEEDEIKIENIIVPEEYSPSDFDLSSEFSITAVPTHTTPALNATSANNRTTDNLTVYNQSTSDSDGDAVKNIINWQVNGTSITVLNLPFEGGSNGTFTKDYSGFGNNGTVNGSTWNST